MFADKCFRSWFGVAFLLILSLVTSCSSEPDDEYYMSLLPVRADIVGAEALVILGGEDSRADNGGFVESGLYKMDKDFNLTAVGFFFKEDGSKQKEEELVCDPILVRNVSDDYVIINAFFLTQQGGNLFYKTVLANKKTGKIFELPYISNVGATQTSANTLLVWESGLVGRVTITSNKAEFEWLNNSYRGFEGGYVKEISNGTILSQDEMSTNVSFLFPNGGYDYLSDIIKDNFSYGMILDNSCAALSVSDVTRWYTVNVGLNPAETEVNLVDEFEKTTDMKNMGYFETANNIIAYGYIFDKRSNKLDILDIPKNLARHIRVSNNNYFAGRMWNVNLDDFNMNSDDISVVWFNPETLESGKINVNLKGVDVDSMEEYYTQGKIIIYGTRRYDSSSVVATVNLETEQTEILFTPPSRIKIQLIPLN